jgi:hypothetical protein
MANTSISGLAGGAAVAAGDLFPDVQTVGVGPVKVTAAQLKTFMSASPTLGAPVVITEAVGSSALTLTGATQTSSFPVLSATQTWNNAGTTFTAWKLNVTNTASNVASNFLDFQLGGTTKFKVYSDGTTYVGSQFTTNGASTFYSSLAVTTSFQTVTWNAGVFGWASTGSVSIGSLADTAFSRISAGIIGVGTGAQGSIAGGLQAATLALGGATIGSNALAVTGTTLLTGTVVDVVGGYWKLQQANLGSLVLASASSIAWASINSNNGTLDTYFGRGSSAASFQFGPADASSAVAQTLQFQSSTGAATTGPTSTIVLAGGVSASGAFQIQKKVNGVASNIVDWGFTTTNAWTFTGTTILAGNGLLVDNATGATRFSAQIGWNAGNVFAASDTILSRASAGILKVSTNGTTGGVINFDPVTVANLPSAATAGKGARAFVTDALGPVSGSTIVGGGAVPYPVFSDGTNWKAG